MLPACSIVLIFMWMTHLHVWIKALGAETRKGKARSALVYGFQDPDAVSSNENSEQKHLEQERSSANLGLAQ